MIDEGLVQGMQRFAAAERAALGFPRPLTLQSAWSLSRTRNGWNFAQLQTGQSLSQEPG